MLRLSHACALALSALVAIASSAAHAQGAPNAPLAEKLYLEGQQLLRAGDPASIQQACDKLAASQRLDPGVGTLLNLAICHERQGKTATAWSELTEVAAEAAHAGQSDRERFARERAAALEKRVHKLAITMVRPAEGARVVLDAQPVPSEAVATEIPLDPGSHTLEVTAPGKRPWAQAVLVGPDGGVTAVSVQLDDAEVLAPPPAPTGETPSPVAHPASGGRSRATLALVALGVGVVAAGVSVGFALHASSLKSSSDSEASGAVQAQLVGNQASHDSLTQRANTDYSSAQTSQTAAIVSGGVALAALAAGVVLFVTSSSAPRDSASPLSLGPLVGRHRRGAMLDLTW